jgi:hypothetical protein
MPSLDTLFKMLTANGRAYLTLLRADRLAIGRVGAAAKISSSQRALQLLIREREIDTLLGLQKRASLPGQLYALLGLAEIGQPVVTEWLAAYKQRTDKVLTQTACLVSSTAVRDVVAHIEDGTYSRLL